MKHLAALATALTIGTTSLVASAGSGDEVALGQEAPPIRTHRTFGFGAGGGGGLQLFFGGQGLTGSAPVLLPAIELQIFPFRRRDWSLDFSIPLWNTIYTAAADDALFLQVDSYLDFNLGKGNVRALLGPGLGVSFRNQSQGASAGPRFLVEFGPEFLFANKHVGLRFTVRPFTEMVLAGSRGGGLEVGAFAVIALTGYTTRVSIADAEP